MKKMDFKYVVMLLSIMGVTFAACSKKSVVEDEDNDPPVELEQSISMDKPSVSLDPEEEIWIQAVFEEGVTPQRSYGWHSSNEEVVSVLEEGNNHSAKILAKNPGNAVVSYRSEDGELEAKCEVEVIDPTGGLPQYHFFTEFISEESLDEWETQNSTATWTAADEESFVLITSSGTAAAQYRTTNLSPFQIPFSVETTLAWTEFYRAGQSTQVRVIFQDPGTPDVPSLREIRWQSFLTSGGATQNQYDIAYQVYIPGEGTVWSTQAGSLPLLIDPVRGLNNTVASTDLQSGIGPTNSQDVLRFLTAENVDRKLSLSIDENYVFHTYVDGEKWFESGGIKQWLDWAKAQYPNFQDPVGVQFAIQAPARQNTTDNNNRTKLKLKSVYMTTDGTILK